MVGLYFDSTRSNCGELCRIVAQCSLSSTLLDNPKGSKGAASPPNMLQKVAQTYCAPFGEEAVYQNVKVHDDRASKGQIFIFFETPASMRPNSSNTVSPKVYSGTLRFIDNMPTTLGLNRHFLVGVRKPKKSKCTDLEKAIPTLLFKIHFCTERCTACTVKAQK